MLHAFVSERPVRTARHLRDVSASVAMHAVLVAAAVVATTTTPAVMQRATGAVRVAERVLFSAVTGPASVAAPRGATPLEPARRRAPRLAVKPAEATLPTIDPAAFDVPDLPTLPTPGSELAERATAGLPIAVGGLADMFAAALGRQRRATPDSDGVYTWDLVEKIVAPVPGNPVPRYPDFLLGAGVEGIVDVRFVVDSTGRIVEQTLVFPGRAHRLFVSAVKHALLHSRFLPAEVDGHRVAQLVSQRFSFVVAR